MSIRFRSGSAQVAHADGAAARTPGRPHDSQLFIPRLFNSALVISIIVMFKVLARAPRSVTLSMVLRYYVNYYVGVCSFQVSEFLEPLPNL